MLAQRETILCEKSFTAANAEFSNSSKPPRFTPHWKAPKKSFKKKLKVFAECNRMSNTFFPVTTFFPPLAISLLKRTTEMH